MSDKKEMNLTSLLNKSRAESGDDILSTTGVRATATFNYENFVDIDNISRSYFLLMIKLNETTKLRSYFAEETFCEKTNKWIIKSTKYTNAFFTSGLVIYEIQSSDNRCQPPIVVIGADSDDETQVLKNKEEHEQVEAKLEQYIRDGYEITRMRWSGCGMKIPQEINLILDPDIVWPKVTLKTTLRDGEQRDIDLENQANIVHWEDSDGSGGDTETGTIISDCKLKQGNTKAILSIKGEVCLSDITLTLPYTCASFDILTGLRIKGKGDSDKQEIILFTT